MSDPTSQQGSQGIDLRALREALVHGRKVIVIVVAVCLTAAALGSLLTTRIYEAVALIQLLPRAGREMNVAEVRDFDEGGYMEGRDRARTQIQIIQSRSVRTEVLERYQALGYTDLAPDQEGVAALGKALSAGPREDTQLVEVRVQHTDPERAALLANLVAKVYWESNLEMRRDVARETRLWLDRQTDDYARQLAEASAKVLTFKEEHDLVDVDEKGDDVSARLASLHGARGDAATERVMVQSKLRQHERLLKEGKYAVLAGMFDDPSLAAMSRELATIQTEAAEIEARYGEKHPEHQRAVAHVERVESLIEAEVRRNVEAERARVKALYGQEHQLNSEQTRVEGELLEKQKLYEEYARLKMDEDRARRLYSSLGERGAEVDLQARTRLNDVRIVDDAIAPTRPARPNVPLNLAMALVVGSMGGVGLALVRHRLDETFLSAADVERRLHLPVLGVLPSLDSGVPLAERPLYTLHHPRSLAAESIRAIRAVLGDYVVPGAGRRLLVTSTLEGEGKTEISVSLAVAFARLGAATLLVDGDLRRPRLHQIFDLERSPGLGDALEGRQDPYDNVRRTQIAGLHVLTAGAAVDHPNELLAAPTLVRAMTHLSQSYHVVIIDSPPAALVADAHALAQGADGVLMVVRHGKARRDLVTKTLEALRQAGARVVGVALNDVPRETDPARYGSRYYEDGTRRSANKRAAQS